MQIYTDKEVLNDGLSTQKATTDKFNTSANECANVQLRDTMLQILQKRRRLKTQNRNLLKVISNRYPEKPEMTFRGIFYTRPNRSISSCS